MTRQQLKYRLLLALANAKSAGRMLGCIPNTNFPEVDLIDVLRRTPFDKRNNILPTELRANDGWHSYDRTPWEHPWLTFENLKAARSFEKRMLGDIIAQYGGQSARAQRYAFVGNLANNMGMRALPMRRDGYSVDLFLHPQDRQIMSQPGWELAELTLLDGETTIDQLHARAETLPSVDRT